MEDNMAHSMLPPRCRSPLRARMQHDTKPLDSPKALPTCITPSPNNESNNTSMKKQNISNASPLKDLKAALVSSIINDRNLPSSSHASHEQEHHGCGSQSSTPSLSPRAISPRAISPRGPPSHRVRTKSDEIRERVCDGKDGYDLIRALADCIEDLQFGSTTSRGKKGENASYRSQDTSLPESHHNHQLAGQLRRLADVFEKENTPSTHRK